MAVLITVQAKKIYPNTRRMADRRLRQKGKGVVDVPICASVSLLMCYICFFFYFIVVLHLRSIVMRYNVMSDSLSSRPSSFVYEHRLHLDVVLKMF